ncbi:MAG: hypothetical protein ACTSQI_11010 [Candidatus Helarchaeota archaeon]
MEEELKKKQLEEIELRINLDKRQAEIFKLQEVYLKRQLELLEKQFELTDKQLELNDLAIESQKNNPLMQLGEKMRAEQEKRKRQPPPDGMII